MFFCFAGRPTQVVVPLVLVSLSFFFPVVLSRSHPSSSPHNQKHDGVYSLKYRQLTVTSEVTTTLFTTDATVTISNEGGPSPTPTRAYTGSKISSFSSGSNTLTPSSSGIENSPSSSSSRTRSPTHTSSRTSTSNASTSSTISPVHVLPTASTTLILVPTPLISTPATTLFVTEPSTILLPSTSQTIPTFPASAVPVTATSTGLWNNKGAVGGIFAAVGLIIAGIIVFLVFYVRRIKKNRSRRYDKELFPNFLDRHHSLYGSTSSVGNRSPLDPFAAGEVVQISSNPPSFHAIGGMPTGPSTPGSGIGHGGSDDGHTSSHGHSSSNHHGFSSISYRTGIPEIRGNIPSSDPSPFQQLPRPIPPSIITSPLHSEDPFSNAAAVPLSAGTASSTYVTPPYLRPGQVNYLRHVDSDASYYAGQIRSYYNGATDLAPSNSYGQAL